MRIQTFLVSVTRQIQTKGWDCGDGMQKWSHGDRWQTQEGSADTRRTRTVEEVGV